MIFAAAFLCFEADAATPFRLAPWLITLMAAAF